MPPYAFSTPCQEVVLACLTDEAQQSITERCALLRSERERLAVELTALNGIEAVFPSDANFLLIKATDADRCQTVAEQAGVLIRNFGWQLPGSLRITVGTPEQNNQLIESLKAL